MDHSEVLDVLEVVDPALEDPNWPRNIMTEQLRVHIVKFADRVHSAQTK